MRLRSLRVDRLPGIAEPFVLDGLADGINVVVGPNASGKSSIVRALRALLYAEEKPGPATILEARFAAADGELRVLRSGTQLTWQHDGVNVTAPALPAHRFVRCFTLGVEDLVAADAATDQVIAERLARELAGGYDIARIRRSWPFNLKSNHGNKAGQRLDEARRNRREREQARERLSQDEYRLAELRRRRDEADEARTEARRAAAAAALLEVRRERQNVADQLADYPDGMERLRGDEWQRLTALRQRHEQHAHELKRAREQREGAQARITATGLLGSGLDSASISEQRQRIQRLSARESELAARRAERERLNARCADTVRALGGEPAQWPELTPKALDRVERALTDKRGLDASIAQLEKELTRTPSAEPSRSDAEVLATARAELLAWLRVAEAPAWPRWRSWLLAVALATGTGGILAAALAGDWRFGLLIVPWGLGLGALIGRRKRGATLTDCQERLARTGVSPPDDWSREAVEQRLAEVDGELVEARQRQAQAQRRRETEQALTAERERLAAVQERLSALATEVGFDVTLADLALDRWLRLIQDHDEARGKLIQTDADIGGLQGQARALNEGVAAFLRGYDQSPSSDEPSADELSTHLETLHQRLGELTDALQARDQAEHAVTRAETELAAVQNEMSAVYEAAGLAEGDDAALRQRLDLLSDWQTLRQRLNDARARESERDRDLGQAPGWRAWVDNDDIEAIRERQRQLDAASAGRDELIQEIERIRGDIERAGHERRLEEARAAEQEAKEAMAQQLDEALFAEAGDYLLGQVVNEHRHSSRPRALASAQDWFASFTHHAYGLDLDETGDEPFRALENSTGEWRRLGELSSGTRMQLLMAVRMGFAQEAEKGAEPLPLMLDEALTTADPERFRAAVDSLRQLADEGRQVFYLTAQPGDVAYWQENDPSVQRLDLGAVRQASRELAPPAAVAMPETPRLPTPGTNASAADYAARLGVPSMDPWADSGRLPTFYLLRDDLALLYRLLQLQLDRLGPLSAFLSSATANEVLSDDERRRLQIRIAGARGWLSAWRVGRGQPVDREALAASQALSEKFFERVAEVNDAVGGDADALLAALADGEVKGLYTRYRDQLAEWLSDNGYRDDGERLNDQAMLQAVMEAVLPCALDRDEAIREARFIRDSLVLAMGGEERQPSLV